MIAAGLSLGSRNDGKRLGFRRPYELIDTKKPSTNWNIDCSLETPWDTAGLDFL